MTQEKPTIKELEQKVKDLEKEVLKRRYAEESLRASEEKYRLLVDNYNYPIVIYDLDGFTLMINQAAAGSLRGKPQDFIGQPIYSLLPYESDIIMERSHLVIKSGTGADYEDMFELSSGKMWVWSNLQPVKDINGRIYAIEAILYDITERKQIDKEREMLIDELEKVHLKLRRLAKIDGLTGIANRREFDETLEREWNRARRNNLPLGLIMADIDDFKNYNDTYGHIAGDDCLKQVSKSLGKTLKRPGDLIARYGGEEFAAILPETDMTGVVQLAEMMRQNIISLDIPHQNSRAQALVTISLGVASGMPNQLQDREALLRTADNALYRAKQAGRNRVVEAKIVLTHEKKIGQ